MSSTRNSGCKCPAQAPEVSGGEKDNGTFFAAVFPVNNARNAASAARLAIGFATGLA
jgi:hypothetical protein